MDILIKDVHKRFGDNVVLRGVDLEIKEGEISVILGGSGAGKSVLLKLILGLMRPDKGSILLNGSDITTMSEARLLPLRRKIGLVFQSGGLLNSLSVGENIALPLKEHRLATAREIASIVAEKLDVLDLQGKESEMPSNLSGGMKKRVSIARTLALNPQVILYDEPTAGLDPPMAENIDNLILDLNKRLGMTTVVVTHDLQSVFKIATKISMLHEGVIVEQGNPREFMASSNEIVREFLHRTVTSNLSEVNQTWNNKNQ